MENCKEVINKTSSCSGSETFVIGDDLVQNTTAIANTLMIYECWTFPGK